MNDKCGLSPSEQRTFHEVTFQAPQFVLAGHVVRRFQKVKLRAASESTLCHQRTSTNYCEQRGTLPHKNERRLRVLVRQHIPPAKFILGDDFRDVHASDERLSNIAPRRSMR